MKKSKVIWGIATSAFFIISLIISLCFRNNVVDDILMPFVFISMGVLVFFNPEFLELVQPDPQDIFTLLIPKLKKFKYSETNKKIGMVISKLFGLFLTWAGVFFLLSTWPFFDVPQLKFSSSLYIQTVYYSLSTPSGMIGYFYSEDMAKSILNIALQLTTEEKAVKIYNISVLIFRIFSISVMVGGPIWGIIVLRRIAGY